jgi:hypothetical protein
LVCYYGETGFGLKAPQSIAQGNAIRAKMNEIIGVKFQRIMNIEEFREHCLSVKGAAESQPLF